MTLIADGYKISSLNNNWARKNTRKPFAMCTIIKSNPLLPEVNVLLKRIGNDKGKKSFFRLNVNCTQFILHGFR